MTEFVRLLTQHQALIRNYIRALIPNASDIPDILQNTNLALWEHREDFKLGTSFKAWAFTVARFRALEHRRKLQRDHRLVFAESLIDLIDQTAYDWDAAQLEKSHAALDHCLSKLKPRDRDLIVARYGSPATLGEYASQDGRSAGSLRVILNRLRSLLRLCIAERMIPEGGAK